MTHRLTSAGLALSLLSAPIAAAPAFAQPSAPAVQASPSAPAAPQPSASPVPTTMPSNSSLEYPWIFPDKTPITMTLLVDGKEIAMDRDAKFRLDLREGTTFSVKATDLDPGGPVEFSMSTVWYSSSAPIKENKVADTNGVAVFGPYTLPNQTENHGDNFLGLVLNETPTRPEHILGVGLGMGNNYEFSTYVGILKTTEHPALTPSTMLCIGPNSLKLAPNSTVPGQILYASENPSFTGTGFAPGTSVNIEFATSDAPDALTNPDTRWSILGKNSVQADAQGNITIPALGLDGMSGAVRINAIETVGTGYNCWQWADFMAPISHGPVPSATAPAPSPSASPVVSPGNPSSPDPVVSGGAGGAASGGKPGVDPAPVGQSSGQVNGQGAGGSASGPTTNATPKPTAQSVAGATTQTTANDGAGSATPWLVFGGLAAAGIAGTVVVARRSAPRQEN